MSERAGRRGAGGAAASGKHPSSACSCVACRSSSCGWGLFSGGGHQHAALLPAVRRANSRQQQHAKQ